MCQDMLWTAPSHTCVLAAWMYNLHLCPLAPLQLCIRTDGPMVQISSGVTKFKEMMKETVDEADRQLDAAANEIREACGSDTDPHQIEKAAIVMAYTVMTCIVMAYTVMACIPMAYLVMA